MKSLVYYSIFLFGIVLGMARCAQAKTIKIAIVDTGINLQKDMKIKFCSEGHADFTGTGFKDNLGHGTNIAYIIADRLKDVDYCMVIIKVFDPKNFLGSIRPSETAFLYLLSVPGLSIVNYSAGGGRGGIPERVAIFRLLAKDVKLISAAGNESSDLDKNCNYFPACYDGVISVGNLLANGARAPKSNYGKRVSAWERGSDVCGGNLCYSGTSQATATHTARIARELSEGKKK